MSISADAIIVGAGHNGLVCAAYLAKAGWDVLVVERSHRIGGGCVTEELVPDHHFSTFAYGAHGPGPKICRDLEVPADAFEIESPDPSLFVPFPDGDHVMLWADVQKTASGLSRFGSHEAEGYLAYTKFMNEAISLAEEWFLSPPMTGVQLHESYRGTPKSKILETLLTRSHWDILCDFFDSAKVRCALAKADDVGDPTTVGSLLAEVVESASRGAGVENKAGIVHGGMGRISVALADAARRYGAEIRTNCPVERIMVEHGRAVGVHLASGEMLRARRCVVSNADPKRTFLRLVDENNLDAGFRRDVAALKTRAGYMKYHAILSDLPHFAAMPRELIGDARAAASVRIAPNLEYFQQAWADAQSGIPAREPVMSLQLPTAYTPEMAPPGRHIFGAWIRYAPARLREGDWESMRESTMLNIVRVIEQYAPGFSDMIVWQKLYTPADIERETGMTDGSIRHLDQSIDQMLHRRPLPACSAYHSPVDGLWLCGSGTHPCGVVTGAPAHNAANAILRHYIDERTTGSHS